MSPVDSARGESIQSKKQELVRHEIWLAGVDLFVADGYDAVTVDQIAARAGVSRRTFFRYFASKDDLMGSTVRGYGEAICAALSALDKDLSVYEAAKRAVAQVLGSQISTVATARFLQIGKRSAAASSAQIKQLPLVEGQIEKAFAVRAGRGEAPMIEDRIAAGMTFSATRLSVGIWVQQQERSLAEIVEEVFGTLSSIFKPAGDARRAK